MTAHTIQPAKEYFSCHPVLRTDDLDEARFRISQKFCDHRLQVRHRQSRLAVRHNAATGQNLSMNYLSYGAEVTVDPGLLESFYLFHLPLSGQSLVQHRGDETTNSPHMAAILNPDRAASLQWGQNCRKLLLQIDKTFLETVATAMVGAPLPGPIRFELKVNLTTPQGLHLKRMVTACAEAIENGNLFQRPLKGGDLRAEFDLAHALLTLQHSNISHIIKRSDQHAKPRSIRMALEYIHANLGEPITLIDIARAAEINVRTLQKGFQRVFGLTPMQVLRNARLDTAHYLLSAKQNPPNVTETAFSSGFSHLGRFSGDYKDRFGHLPSEKH